MKLGNDFCPKFFRIESVFRWTVRYVLPATTWAAVRIRTLPSPDIMAPLPELDSTGRICHGTVQLGRCRVVWIRTTARSVTPATPRRTTATFDNIMLVGVVHAYSLPHPGDVYYIIINYQYT